MVTAKPIRRRVKTTTLVNPQHKQAKQASGAHCAPKKRNPGNLITLGFLNPQEKPMQKKKVQNAPKKKGHVAKNPQFHSKSKALAPRKKSHQQRNPAPGLVSKPLEMLKLAIYAALGLIATRQLPQILLKENNKGLIGYGSNFVTAISAAAIAKKAAGAVPAIAVLIGGSLYTFNRLLNDYTPLGKQLALSGIGDVHACGSLRGLLPAYQPTLVMTRNGQAVLPRAVLEQMRALIPAPAAAASQGLNGASFGGR